MGIAFLQKNGRNDRNYSTGFSSVPCSPLQSGQSSKNGNCSPNSRIHWCIRRRISPEKRKTLCCPSETVGSLRFRRRQPICLALYSSMSPSDCRIAFTRVVTSETLISFSWCDKDHTAC